MTTETERGLAVRIGTVAELERDGVKVVAAEGRTIAVYWTGGRAFAVDNRCPHMGFPLSRGSVRDGILTCHWHHARFDLAGGCTFDPFADDVASFATEVRDGVVWVDPRPLRGESDDERRTRWTKKLDDGLEQNLRLVVAKAVVGLDDLGEATAVVERAARFGTTYRASGWADGLSILTAMANVLPVLAAGDRPRALYHGAMHVARNVAGQPPDFDLDPLSTSERRPEVFRAWFRGFAETRSRDASERCLRTAIAVGLAPRDLADMLLVACTDHLFMDEGHALDFTNKACELLDHIGWQHAAEILPSVIPDIVGAERSEETSSWRHPVDLPALLRDANEAFGTALDEGRERLEGWDGHRALAESVLDDEPQASLAAIVEATRAGAPLRDLSAAVAYAAARRALHFHTSNEFGDWNTVHHTFTYCNAVDQAMRRAPSRELARGILDGAMSVYLERFLNVPRQPVPRPSRAVPEAEALLAEFDRQQRVDETAQLVADMLAAGRHDEVIETLGHALLREDAGFHSFQIYEAAVRQYGNFRGRPEGDEILVGAARFLTAHAPTVRSAGQTFEIAARLQRGEALQGAEQQA